MHPRTARPEGQSWSALGGTRRRVPALTYFSGLVTGVVEMMRVEAQSRAEIAGYEDQSWMSATRAVRLVINSRMAMMKL